MTTGRITSVVLLGLLLCGCGASGAARRPAPDGKPWLSAAGGIPPPDATDRLARVRFRIPVEGSVSDRFGGRGGGRHSGVDILAPRGTEVRAAAPGTVVFAGDGLRGYGNTVVLDHGDGVTTLYGHLEAIRVESGDAVPGGGGIGAVGRTGNATTYHLHFEIRVDGVPVDPLAHLLS